MAIVVPTEGEVIALKLILGAEVAEDLYLKLFVNNLTPTKAVTAASFTEANGFGYVAFTLIKGTEWAFTPGDPSKAETAFMTFTFTGALGMVYGYWIEGSVSGKVYWCERFTAPIAVTVTGDKVIIPVVQTCE
jgi:hypothetical protein